MFKEKFDLSHKVALVVGGRGRLGSQFCAALAEFGATVHSADQSSAAAGGDVRELSQLGVKQHDVNVTDPASVRTLIDEVMTTDSQIDVLLYSVTAKPNDFYKPFTECSLDGWQLVMKTEMDGLFLVTREVGRVMEQVSKGSIIFLSSIYGIVGNDQRIYEGSNLEQVHGIAHEGAAKRIYSHAVYAAAKGAVISLTRYLAAYWGEHNIRVNCISPGGIAHPAENEQFVKRYSERVPFGRKGRVDEISGAAVFLASDASSYVTGHNLVVDGGWTAW